MTPPSIKTDVDDPLDTIENTIETNTSLREDLREPVVSLEEEINSQSERRTKVMIDESYIVSKKDPKETKVAENNENLYCTECGKV